MVKILAAIPTIGESPLLEPLVHQLVSEGVEVTLYVNRADARLPLSMFLADDGWNERPGVCVQLHDGYTIYQGWNHGILRAQAREFDALAILNDDIVLGPGAVGRAAGMLLQDDRFVVAGLDYFANAESRQPEMRQVEGSYRHGGVGGFAFVVKPKECPSVDEQFEWWGGDDDLLIQARGRVGIADSCAVSHVAETTAVKHPWTLEARWRDRERFEAKYPGQGW